MKTPGPLKLSLCLYARLYIQEAFARATNSYAAARFPSARDDRVSSIQTCKIPLLSDVLKPKWSLIII